MIFEVNVKHTETYMDSTVGFDDNPEDFLYYDKGKEEFLSENEWKEKHFENRFKLNCYYDKYLPIFAYEAERMG